MTACPMCFLPKDEGAWQCDGCGYRFSQDLAQVRAQLEAQVRDSRLMVWWAFAISAAIVGVVIYLATIGYIYISVPLALAVVGWIASAFHQRSVMREHLRTFERRHPQLPKATVVNVGQ